MRDERQQLTELLSLLRSEVPSDGLDGPDRAKEYFERAYVTKEKKWDKILRSIQDSNITFTFLRQIATALATKGKEEDLRTCQEFSQTLRTAFPDGFTIFRTLTNTITVEDPNNSSEDTTQDHDHEESLRNAVETLERYGSLLQSALQRLEDYGNSVRDTIQEFELIASDVGKLIDHK